MVQGLRAVVAIPLYASSRATSDTGAPTGARPIARRHLSRLAAHRCIFRARPPDSGCARRAGRQHSGQRAAGASGNASASAWSRSSRSPAPSSRRFCRNGLERLSASWPSPACIILATEVGGDYFDVVPISEDRTAILIADVSGKGLGAALLTTMLQGPFRV